jgi:hypothetical protein
MLKSQEGQGICAIFFINCGFRGRKSGYCIQKFVERNELWRNLNQVEWFIHSLFPEKFVDLGQDTERKTKKIVYPYWIDNLYAVAY